MNHDARRSLGMQRPLPTRAELLEEYKEAGELHWLHIGPLLGQTASLYIGAFSGMAGNSGHRLIRSVEWTADATAHL